MSKCRRQTDPVDRLERPVPLVVQVEQALRKAITGQSFPDGRLPTEIELAESFGVSRETVRRAAEVLQREGLLRKYRRRGTLVDVAQPAMVWPAAEVATLLGFVVGDYRTERGERDSVGTGSAGLMLQGAVVEAGRANCELIVRSVSPGEVRGAVEKLAARGVRGAVLTSIAEDKSLRRLGGRSLPLVLLDHDLNVPRLPSIRDDSALGSRLAVEHLVRLGHREVAYIHWQQADLNPWRLRGYREGLSAAGLRRSRSFELFAEITPAGAERVAQVLVDLHPRPTAVVCFNNTLARWLVAALRKVNIGVPEEMSVVGCGGEEVADLTTCQTDWYDMGRRALRLLLDRMAEPGRVTEHLRIAPQLSPGTTTSPPQASP